jgi:uncharacterized membrane protein
MNAFLDTLQRWDLHPVVDHFTVSLLIVGVLIDLVASMAPTRTWLRYMALTLMLLGAIAAGCSYFTGAMEADRLGKLLEAEGVAKIFSWHARLGQYFAVVFGVLAVWRILIEGVGFFAGSRPVYLIVAIISAGVLGYIGHLGGQMVYTYGVGTQVAGAPPTEVQPTPVAIPIPEVPNAALPTVSVPSPTASITTPTPVVMPLPPAATVAAPTIVAPLPTPAATP